MSKKENVKASRTLIKDITVEVSAPTDLLEEDLNLIVGGMRAVASTCHQSGGNDCD